jgi:hypothetical protein
MGARITEKRRTPRIQPYVVPCRVVRGRRRFIAYLTDLSPRGGRVACDADPPPPGTRVVLEVRIGRRVSHSRLPAVVKWARAGTRGTHTFGLTFQKISAEARRALEIVLDDFRRLAAQIA